MQNNISVTLVAQNAIIRMGLRKMLSPARDIQIIGEAANGSEVSQLMEMMNPDVLIIQLEMPTMEDGIHIMEQIKQRGSQARIILISMERDADIAPELKKRGAWEFFSRQFNPTEVLEMVRQAGRGQNP